MASFSDRFRYAYHVAPLHALKIICSRRALVSKAALASEIGIRRSTTANVDERLGFSDFVHLYLPRGSKIDFTRLPILLAQMGQSDIAPFPHVVLVVDTQPLTDGQCVVCNFNIAASRPAYPGVGAGMHARGTPPDTILGHWQRFRASNPSNEAMRRSHWHDGLAVPVLAGRQITNSPASVGSRSSTPELLLKSRYSIQPTDRLFVFSEQDAATVRSLNTPPKTELAVCKALAWYSEKDHVNPAVRAAISAYFAKDDAPFPTHLDYDRVRPRPAAQSQDTEVTA